MVLRDYLGVYINGKINRITSGNYHFGNSINFVYTSLKRL